MTASSEILGLEIIREIAKQGMIKAKPQYNPDGSPTGYFDFHWAGNAPEQLEAHIAYVLRDRGYMIVPNNALILVPADHL